MLAVKLRQWLELGGRLLLYGPIAHGDPELLKLLNLKVANALDGELDLKLSWNLDELHEAAYPRKIHHHQLLSGGPCRAVPADPKDSHTQVMAEAAREGQTRVIALFRKVSNSNEGAVAWIRGTNSFTHGLGRHMVTADDPEKLFHSGILTRYLLAGFGVKLAFNKDRPSRRTPMTCIARCRNAFFFSGYTPDTTVALSWRFPQGAPLFIEHETGLKNGHAQYHMPRACRYECRVFIDRQTEGVLSCTEQPSIQIDIKRRILVTGLNDARIRFYPETGASETTRILRNPQFPFLTGDWVTTTRKKDHLGDYLQADHITGSVLISW